MRRGDKIPPGPRTRCRARPFTHARHSIETRSRDDATTRSIDPFVRSVASIRSHRRLSHRSRHARFASAPIDRRFGPSGRRVERANRRSRVGGSSDLCALVLARSTSTRSNARGRRDVEIFIRVFVRSRDADADAVDDERDEGDARARRDRSTRATSRRRQRDEETEGVDLTSRDSWTRDEEGGSTGRGCG